MHWFSRCFGVLVALGLILPSFGQDAKKDPAKPGVKKDDDKKKDPADKDPVTKDKGVKKDKKVKGKPKEDAPPEEKVVYGQTISGKLKMDANSQKDFAVEIMLPDPQKVLGVQQWSAQRIFQIRQNGNPAQRQQSLIQYQMELAQKQATIYSPKDIELRAAETIKVRSLYPPADYDDKGNPKRWTAKELKALKGNSKLPGYPVEYDALKPGQIVQAYLAKLAPATKIKGIKIEEPMEAGMNRPKVVMIVVVRDVVPGQR